MDWFTPERRLATYNIVASLVGVAIALNVIDQTMGNDILNLFTQVVNSAAAIGALAAPLLARLHVNKK
jgi:hypothetical protein